jgi:hypothetical protein
MYNYTTIHSINFMVSLSSENLKNIECRIIKRYNGWINVIRVYYDRDHFPCKFIKKHKILNYTFTWL